MKKVLKAISEQEDEEPKVSVVRVPAPACPACPAAAAAKESGSCDAKKESAKESAEEAGKKAGKEAKKAVEKGELRRESVVPKKSGGDIETSDARHGSLHAESIQLTHTRRAHPRTLFSS